MQIKRHWFLVETMPFEYFFSGVRAHSGCVARTTSRPYRRAHSDCAAHTTTRPYRRVHRYQNTVRAYNRQEPPEASFQVYLLPVFCHPSGL